MTEEHKAELEAIKVQKRAHGIRAANSVMEVVLELKSKLDPSEFWECLYQLQQRLEGLEHEASGTADAHEKMTYGVSLEDIDGQFDEPMKVSDLRQQPTDRPLQS